MHTLGDNLNKKIVLVCLIGEIKNCLLSDVCVCGVSSLCVTLIIAGAVAGCDWTTDWTKNK